MKNHALLLRLSPVHWPNWATEISKEPRQWFRTGRRRTEGLIPGVPAVVLGTCGLGLVGFGETITGVEFCSDLYWQQAAPEYRGFYRRNENRIRTRIRPVPVPVAEVKANPVTAPLINRRETTTWISEAQYDAFVSLGE